MLLPIMLRSLDCLRTAECARDTYECWLVVDAGLHAQGVAWIGVALGECALAIRFGQLNAPFALDIG